MLYLYLDEYILQKNYPSKNFLLSNESLAEDLVVSDVIIVLPISTVSLEAIMFDIPIIFPDINKKNKNKLDPIFKLLVENNLGMFTDESTLIDLIKNEISHKTIDSKIMTKSINFNQKEKIIKYLSNYSSDPKIHNYISK